MADLPHIVLVHGAWTDGSSWHKVIEILQQQGYEVIAAQLSLHTIEEDTKIVERIIAMQNAPTILVGHSYGGVVITNASNSPHIIGLIYVSAFAPKKKETMKQILSHFPQMESAKYIKLDSDGFLWIKRSTFSEYFSQDLDKKETDILSAVQKPISADIFTQTVQFVGWKKMPSWYLLAEQDRQLHPDAQLWMADRIHAHITSLTASHAVLLSHPHEVVNLINEAVEETHEIHPHFAHM